MSASQSTEWRIIEVRPGRFMSACSDGRIMGISRKILKPHLNNKGYPMVPLYENGKLKWLLVSHLVLTAFAGPRPDGAVARHILNNDKTDCRAENLAWGTAGQNIDDKHGHDTFGWKLSARQVKNIRKKRSEGVLLKVLAAKYKVSEGYLSKLCGPNSPHWKSYERASNAQGGKLPNCENTIKPSEEPTLPPLDSGSRTGNGVWVQVPPSAHA